MDDAKIEDQKNHPVGAPSSPKPPRRRSRWKVYLFLILFALLGLAAVDHWAWGGRLRQAMLGTASPARDELALLRQDLDGLAARVNELEDLRARLADIENAFERLGLGGAATPNAQSAPPDTPPLAAIERRISLLEQKIIAQDLTAPARGPAVEAAALERVTARLNDLDARLAHISQIQALIQGNGLPIAITLMRLDRALADGEPYQTYLAKLDQLASNVTQAAPPAFLNAAAQGLPSFAALRAEFPVERRRALRAVAGDENQGFWTRMTASLGQTFRLRRTDEPAEPKSSRVMDDIESALRSGQYDRVPGLVAALPAPQQEALAGWRAKLESRLAAESAVALIEAELIARFQR